MKTNVPSVLVTGASGQLGSELKIIASQYPGFHFFFTTRNELSIDDFDSVKNFFNDNKIDTCINCAAYTAVDKAETEPEKAMHTNAAAVGNLATVCAEKNCRFIHISTDYVFDGTATQPYKETDLTSPVSFYSRSKVKGEELALKNNPSSLIIRTSWLYSSFGSNFVKTMIRLMKERENIKVVNDQIGSPTYAADLAAAIMKIISSDTFKSGIYHYANTGTTTWFEFAIAIKELTGSTCLISPIPTSEYPTPAKRPAYSVFDTSKIKASFAISIPAWKESLKNCIKLLQ